MMWGVGLLAQPAHAQGTQGTVTFYTSADTGSGSTRQTFPQVIHIMNASNVTEASGVTVTFTPPKGVKVDSGCLVDHMAGGLRSYTCLVGTIAPLATVDVVFSISATKAGDASFWADVACDQGTTTAVFLSIVIS
jgi:hypothetical protein